MVELKLKKLEHFFFKRYLSFGLVFPKPIKYRNVFGIKDNVYQKSDFFSGMTFTYVFFL